MATHMTRSRTVRLLQTKSFSAIPLQEFVVQSVPRQKVRAPLGQCAYIHSSRSLSSGLCVLTARHVSRRLKLQSTPSAAAFLRFNSSTSGANIPDVANSSTYIDPPAGYIPPAPPVPEASATPGTDSLIEAGLNALGEPSLQSMGLGSVYPAGLVQQGLEMLHVGLGLPWWGSIVAGTIVLRLCMFPIVIKARRMTINMMNHMPTIQRLQLKFTQARQRGNMLEAMRYGGELGEYMKKHEVKPFGQMLMPLCQAPVFVSVFVGLRGMANLPVESMKEGGILFFTDLTITQPFYALPMLTALTFWATIEAGVDGMSAQSQTHVMKWVLRGLPFVMWPFISNFPTAMLVYWFTSNTFSLCQVLFLKIPQVQRALKLPKVMENKDVQPVKKGFLEGFKESYSNMKASQQVMERQRLDEVAYRKAAYGPVVKTYSTNPKLKQGDSKTASKSKS